MANCTNCLTGAVEKYTSQFDGLFYPTQAATGHRHHITVDVFTAVIGSPLQPKVLIRRKSVLGKR